MTIFPYELYEKILFLLENHSAVLAQSALVDNAFRLIAQTAMWRTLRVHPERRFIGHLVTQADVDNGRALREFFGFLQEDGSRHLLDLILSAEIEFDSLTKLGVIDDVCVVLIDLINLRWLTLHTHEEWDGQIYSIPASIHEALSAGETVWPQLDKLCLQGFKVPILDIMSTRPGIQHLGLDNVVCLRARIQTGKFNHFKTSLQTLSIDSYLPIDFHSSSPLMDLVHASVSQNTLRALLIGTHDNPDFDDGSWLPRLFSTPMVKMCAAILTTLCLGYDVYDGIAANCLSNEDLGILNFRNFRSLQTLQFDIIPEEINSTPGDSPTPFLLWLAAEVEGIVEIQGPRHAFSCLRFDFVTVTETEDDVSRILQWTKGWKALDMVLAKESVHLVFFIEFDYFPRFDNPMARIFPLCSGKGMACLEVYEDCLEAQFGIRNVVLQA